MLVLIFSIIFSLISNAEDLALQTSFDTLCMQRIKKIKSVDAKIKKDICACEWKNMRSEFDDARMEVIVKEAKGKSVQKDLRKFEDGQVIFDYVFDVRDECKVNPFWVKPPEDPGIPDQLPPSEAGDSH